MTVPGYADTRRPTRIFVDAHVFDGEHQGSRTYLQGLYQALSKVTTDVEVTLAARNIAQLEDCFAGCRGIRFETLRSKGSYARLGYEMPGSSQRGNMTMRTSSTSVLFVRPPVSS